MSLKPEEIARRDKWLREIAQHHNKHAIFIGVDASKLDIERWMRDLIVDQEEAAKKTTRSLSTDWDAVLNAVDAGGGSTFVIVPDGTRYCVLTEDALDREDVIKATIHLGKPEDLGE